MTKRRITKVETMPERFQRKEINKLRERKHRWLSSILEASDKDGPLLSFKQRVEMTRTFFSV